MNKFLVVVSTILFIACSGAEGQLETEADNSQAVEQALPTNYAVELQADRDSINRYFSNPQTTQLTAEDLAQFTGLHFYAANEGFAIPAEFERIAGAPIEEFATTTERMAKYRAKGYLKFEYDGNPYQLTVYENAIYATQPHYDGSLFLPFTDVTNGKESYGGGRYLDFNIKEMDNVVIDFNRSYNPYCAYNPKYSCPIPPLENDLDFKVEAGIKKWHD